MDLSNYDLRTKAEDGHALTVLDPITFKPTDLVIHVIGSDSKVFRRARAQALRDVAKAPKEGEEFDTDTVLAKVCAGCVTGWENMIENGEPVAFSTEKALDLLTRMGWLLDQVSGAIETRANFTKPAETN